MKYYFFTLYLVCFLGQMLVCAVSSLFDKVDTAMLKLRDRVLTASTPPEFMTFSTVMTALDISTPAFNPTPGVWEVVSLTTFLCKLDLLDQFFTTCRSFAAVFNLQALGQGLPLGYALVRPVKQYTLEYVKGLLVGTGPRHLTCAIAQFARDTCPGAVTR